MSTPEGKFQGFLDALATKGGNILLLLVSNVVLLVLVVWLHRKGFDQGALAVALTQTLGNFSGALLMALTGKDRTVNNAPKP